MFLKILVWLSILYLAVRYAWVIFDWLIAPRSINWELHPIKKSFWRLFTEMITFHSYKDHPNKQYRTALMLWHYCLIFSIIYHESKIMQYHIPYVLVFIMYLLGTGSTLFLLFVKTNDLILFRFLSTKHYLTALLILFYFITGILMLPPDIISINQFWKEFLTSNTPEITLFAGLHLSATAMLFFYLPSTRMFHYILRFFNFYTVIWRDKPLQKSEKQALIGYLDKTPSWQANHFDYAGNWGQKAEKIPLYLEKEDADDE